MLSLATLRETGVDAQEELRQGSGPHVQRTNFRPPKNLDLRPLLNGIPNNSPVLRALRIDQKNSFYHW